MVTVSSTSRNRVPSSTVGTGSRLVSRSSFGGGARHNDRNGSGRETAYIDPQDQQNGKLHPPSAFPLNAITNRTSSSSHEGGNGGGMSSRKAFIKPVGQSSDADRSTDRIHGPRSSQNGLRTASSRVPSALRRLPPAGSRVASRSILPSGTYANDASASSSSNHQPSSTSSRPAVSALARAGRRSLGATLNAAGAGGAAQHERDGREITKLTVDSTSFEEWMKMATDNKINATNTWNFALIDYFHDMSLLRSDNGDGSINFQKASCTLDGCVKVWTSRVDSVVVETGKLLSGLQEDGKEAATKNSRGRNADDEEGAEGGEDDDDVDGQGPRRKRSRAKEPTLAKSFTQLAVKKLDLEFTVDPLFKKTSADFDEGGAGGLLMNHLGVDSMARIVFDASDVPGQDDLDEENGAAVAVADEDAMEDDEASETNEIVRKGSAEQQDTIDISKLRGKLFGQHDVGHVEDALSDLLNGMTVCPTFSSFRFAPDDNTPFSALMADNEAGPSDPAFDARASSVPSWDMALDDNALGFEADNDDGLDDAFGFSGGVPGPSSNLYEANGDVMEYGDAGFDDAGAMAGDYGFGDTAPSSRPAINFTTPLQGLLDGSADQAFEGDDFFGYFDQRMSKNWAGPEHWKMRNLINPNNPLSAAKGVDAAAAAVNRKAKEPFLIDFASSEGAITSKELFEKPSSSSATLLPSSKEDTDIYLLPEDRHYSSKKLLRLFIKPRAILNPRRTGQLLESRGMPRSDLDADFWVQAAAQNGGAHNREGGAALGYDADEGGMPEVPFDTQFFHEDDGGFDPMDDGEGGEHALALEQEDEELVTQALKRIRPEFVNYAKKAKRVDVRKLKENIWRELAIVVSQGQAGDDEDDSGLEDVDKDSDGGGPTTPKATNDGMTLDQTTKRDPTDPRTFDNVLSGLRKLYSKDRMDEISTSFCFICLLHLANEEGLRIKTAPEGLGGLNMLAGRAIVEEDEDEEDDDDEEALAPRRSRMTKSNSNDVFNSISSKAASNNKNDAEDADFADFARVGFLEQLSIAKDPNAGRSA